MEKLFQLLFPVQCIYCKSFNGEICTDCMLKSPRMENGYCIVCDKASIFGYTHSQCSNEHMPRQIFSAFLYEGVVRDCIKRSKYQQKSFGLLKHLTLISVDYAMSCGMDYANFLVVPIPLSKDKYRSRGFNQVSIISSVLCNKYKLIKNEKVLIRSRKTASQYENSRDERFKNLKGAFSINGNVMGKKILLVDDICTTGATLLEACRVLYELGALEVKCFTVAKKL